MSGPERRGYRRAAKWWERLDTKRASRIAKHFTKHGYKDEDHWQELAETLIDNMIQLEKALSPYLNK